MWRQHFEPSAFRMKPRLDLAEVRNRARNAVNLGDHEHITFAGEVERRLELRTFRVNARKLFREYLCDTGRPQIPKLSLKPGCLFKRRGPCISDFHVLAPFVPMTS